MPTAMMPVPVYRACCFKVRTPRSHLAASRQALLQTSVWRSQKILRHEGYCCRSCCRASVQSVNEEAPSDSEPTIYKVLSIPRMHYDIMMYQWKTQCSLSDARRESEKQLNASPVWPYAIFIQHSTYMQKRHRMNMTRQQCCKVGDSPRAAFLAGILRLEINTRQCRGCEGQCSQ